MVHLLLDFSVSLSVAVTTFGLAAPFPSEPPKTADVVVEGRQEGNELRPVVTLEVATDERDVVHLLGLVVGIVVSILDTMVDQGLAPPDQSSFLVRTCTDCSTGSG